MKQISWTVIQANNTIEKIKIQTIKSSANTTYTLKEQLTNIKTIQHK